MTTCPWGIFSLLLFGLVCRQVCGRYFHPMFIRPFMHNQTVIKGEDVDFVCQVANLGRNMVAFLRVKNIPRVITYGHTVFRKSHKYSLYSQIGDTRWILTIHNVNERDVGMYMCQVNSDPVLIQTAHIDLLVPPRVDRNTASTVEVREGHNVTLTCNAIGSPTPTIIWRRHDQGLIRFDGSTGYAASVSNGSDLHLRSVGRQFSDDYVCVASNGVLPDESWTVKLHVTFAPVVVPQTRRIWTKIGRTVRLVCLSEAWPRAQFRWQKNGRPVEFNSNKYKLREDIRQPYFSTVTLTVLKVDNDDFGTYTCTATNDQGDHSVRIQLIESTNNGNIVEDGYALAVDYPKLPSDDNRESNSGRTTDSISSQYSSMTLDIAPSNQRASTASQLPSAFFQITIPIALFLLLIWP